MFIARAHRGGKSGVRRRGRSGHQYHPGQIEMKGSERKGVAAVKICLSCRYGLHTS